MDVCLLINIMKRDFSKLCNNSVMSHNKGKDSAHMSGLLAVKLVADSQQGEA